MLYIYRELYNCYLYSLFVCNFLGLFLYVLYMMFFFKKFVNLCLIFEYIIRMNKFVLLVFLVMVKVVSGLDVVILFLIFVVILVVMFLVIFSDDESLGGSLNGCK